MKPKQKQNKNQKNSFGTADLLLNKKIVSPQKLKILVLSGNDLINEELEFLSKCINLIKLDLSHNHITKISAKLGINKIKNLKVLHLDSNKLMQIQSIQGLFQAPYIEMFSYKENLLQQNPKAEHLIINNFKNLKILNERVVFVEERDPNIILQKKIVLIQKYYQNWVPMQNSQTYYLKVLRLQLRYIDNVWMHNNPIIKIQRIWKKILQQKKNLAQLNKTLQFSKRSSHVKDNLEITKQLLPQNTELKNAFQIWKRYYQSMKQIKLCLKAGKFLDQNGKSIQLQDKEYLTFEMSQCNIAKRNLKIKVHLEIFLKKIRAKLYIRKMAKLFRNNIALKSLSFHETSSYFYLSEINLSRRVYFNRAQQHLIQNFLCHIAKNFKMPDQIYNKSTFGISNKFVAIRLMDPDTYSNKKCYNTFNYLLWPSMKAIILKKKKFPYKPRSSIIKVKPLTYIKNRDKKLSKQQRKKYIETYKQIDRFFQNEYYESFAYFECPHDFVLQQLIRMVFYHNMKALKFQKIIQRSQMLSLLQNYQQPIAIFSEKLLQRTTSAVKIQQQWRRYINNKRQKESIYQKLLKKRAAMKIQRFLRDRIFYHRLSFQKNIALDLELFQGTDLMFPQSCYMSLEKAVHQKNKYELFKDLNIGIINNQLKTKFKQFNKQVFSPLTRKRYFKDISLKSEDYFNNDIYRLFHHESEVKKVQVNGELFYQFNYKTPEDTKIRIACFALLSYKIYGGKYILPLSLSTINLYPQRMLKYKQYGLIDCQVKVKKQYKINNKNNVTQNTCGYFVFIREDFKKYFPECLLGTIQAEFYQKKYQNFPLKYQNIMFWVDNRKKIDVFKQKLDKDLTRQQHLHFLELEQPEQRPTQYRHFIQGEIKPSLGTISFHQQLNISKINQKKLSLNLLDYPPIPQDQIEKMKMTQQLTMEIRKTEMQNKKDMITKFLNQQREKRQYDKEKRKSDLGLLRDRRKQEKIMNMTLRNINQSQRTQQLRKKVNKIKEVKARSRSKKGNDQQDFIQQGNFIMQQQLKMVIMRNKMKQNQKLKTKRNSLVQTRKNWTRTQKSQGAKSFYSNKSHQKRQKSALQLQNNSSVLKQPSKQISGGHTQIINKRVYIKKRSSNTGAYIRDPSFVHGVFPEQYYPIQSKGALFLPKV